MVHQGIFLEFNREKDSLDDFFSKNKSHGQNFS